MCPSHHGKGVCVTIESSTRPRVPSGTTLAVTYEAMVPVEELHEVNPRFTFFPTASQKWGINIAHSPMPMKWLNHDHSPNSTLAIIPGKYGRCVCMLDTARDLRMYQDVPGRWRSEELTIRYTFLPDAVLAPWYSPATRLAHNLREAAKATGRITPSWIGRLPWPVQMRQHPAMWREYAGIASAATGIERDTLLAVDKPCQTARQRIVRKERQASQQH